MYISKYRFFIRIKICTLWNSNATIKMVNGVFTRTVIFFFTKRLPRVGANPGPLDLIYFLIFTTLPLSHSGSP
jgi:hypothetical protein